MYLCIVYELYGAYWSSQLFFISVYASVISNNNGTDPLGLKRLEKWVTSFTFILGHI